MAKSKKLLKRVNLCKFYTKETKLNFLNPSAKKSLNCLWLAFTKASILWYFDLECYIWIEANALGYVIYGVLNQLAFRTNLNKVVTKTNLGQWHPIAFFFIIVIFVKTQYKTYNSKLFAIVKTFKICVTISKVANTKWLFSWTTTTFAVL